jgi:diguanylate cyclase (GGDEF)-like protein
MKRNFFTLAFNNFDNVRRNKNRNNFALFFGNVFSLFLFIEQMAHFLFYDKNLVEDKFVFLFLSIAFLTFYICFVIAFRSNKPKLDRYVGAIFPYFVIFAGVIGVLNSLRIDSIINPFVIKIFVAAFLRVYSNKERIVVAIYSFLLFNLAVILLVGFNDIAIRYLFLSFESIIFAFLLSYIIYVIYQKQEKSLTRLDEENKKYELTMKELQITQYIVESMFALTKEVLENESLEVIMQQVLEKSVKLVPKAISGSILIKSGEKMRYIAAYGYDLEELQNVTLSFEETFQADFNDVFAPFIINDLEGYNVEHWGEEKFREFQSKHRVARSCLTCSFKHNDEFFGSINLDSFEEEDIFGENEKYFIKKIAEEIEIIISIHKLYEDALKPAKYDELTKIYNRTYLLTTLEQLIVEKKPFSLCLIDINYLKIINDTYGHHIGDDYINFFVNEVVNLEMKNLIFGRFGGDEFLLIFENISKEKLKNNISNIKENFMNHLFMNEDLKIELKFGLGSASYPIDGDDVKVLIRTADERMYKDKSISKANNSSL